MKWSFNPLYETEIWEETIFHVKYDIIERHFQNEYMGSWAQPACICSRDIHGTAMYDKMEDTLQRLQNVSSFKWAKPQIAIVIILGEQRVDWLNMVHWYDVYMDYWTGLLDYVLWSSSTGSQKIPVLHGSSEAHLLVSEELSKMSSLPLIPFLYHLLSTRNTPLAVA